MALSGSLVKQAQRTQAGSAASSGSLAKRLGRSLSGSVGLSGSLTVLKIVLLNLAGTLGMSGAVRHSLVRSFSGSISSAGLVVKGVGQGLVGSVGLSGSLTLLRTLLLTLSGTLGLSGSLTVEKLAGLLLLTLTGSLGSTGALRKAVAWQVTAVLASSGLVIKAVTHRVAGVITLAAAVASILIPPMVPGVGTGLGQTASLMRRLQLLGVRDDGATEMDGPQRRRHWRPWWLGTSARR